MMLVVKINAHDTESLRNRIRTTMRVIRSATPQISLPLTKAKGSEVWPGCRHGRPANRVIIYLRSSGCFWAIRRAQSGEVVFKAGCLDCEHSVAETTFGRPISANDYVEQFMGEYNKYGDFSEFPTICIYNEGNFFNPQELPEPARDAILRVIGDNPNIESVIIESLPETIKARHLEVTKSFLGDKEVEIAIGLESVNPEIRTLCVNKSYDLPTFVKTVNLIRKYFDVLAYVLLKPSFLEEREAIEDAVATTQYAFNHGVKVVSLEPVGSSKHNMAGVLETNGLRRVPWLWSVVEVLRRVRHLGEVRVGGLQFAPRYRHVAYNCQRCSEAFYQAIERYNCTLDFSIFEELDCSCKSEWAAELDKPLAGLPDRISRALEALHPILGRSESSLLTPTDEDPTHDAVPRSP